MGRGPHQNFMTWYAKMNIHCKYDELVDVKALRPHPKNRNKHPDDQIERLAKILKYQGIRAPIVVSKRSNKIVKGHGTLQAIKANQWDKAPVVYQDFEDDDQEWLFVQSDNAIASWAELDLKGINADLGELGPFDIDLIGIKDFVVEPAEKDLGDEEATPEVRETDIKLGDLFILGDHRLLCGDSTDAEQVKRLMNNEKPILMVTDPPYGVEYDPNWREEAAKKGLIMDLGVKNKGLVKNDDIVDWSQVWKSWDIPVVYCWHASVKAWEVAKSFLENDYKIVSQLVWVKPRFAISRKNYNWRHEPCWFVVKNKSTQHWIGPQNLSTVIEADNLSDERMGHGTQKPIKVMEFPIANHVKAGEIVVDPFLGSGTTLIACEKTNRRCFGMELDPQYCQVIIDRWEQYTGKKAVKNG